MNELDKVLAALAALLVAVYPLVKAWVQAKLSPTTLRNVTDLARVAVNAAEGVGAALPDLTGEQKLNIAAKYLSDAAKRLGLKLSPNELQVYIEAALRNAKQFEKQLERAT